MEKVFAYIFNALVKSIIFLFVIGYGLKSELQQDGSRRVLIN